jgi:acetyltransferase
MSIRNLDAIFKPRSIALIGASKQRSSVGAVVAYNLFNFGFTGPIRSIRGTGRSRACSPMPTPKRVSSRWW